MQLYSAEASGAAREAQSRAHDPPRRPCLLVASAGELGYGLTPRDSRRTASRWSAAAATWRRFWSPGIVGRLPHAGLGRSVGCVAR